METITIWLRFKSKISGRPITFIFSFIVIFFAIQNIPNRALAENEDNFRICGKTFETLWSKFESTFGAKYELIPRGHAGELGFYLLNKDPTAQTTVRHVSMEPDPADFQNLTDQMWQKGQDSYYFFNTGFKIMEHSTDKINLAVVEHIENFPDQNLAVLYLSPWDEFISRLSLYRWGLHEAVLNKYLRKKPYLTPIDFDILAKVPKFSANSDVFGLMGYDPDREISPSINSVGPTSLLMTIQISYFGNKSFVMPSLREMFSAAGLPIFEDNDRLPFEYRFQETMTDRFRKRLYARFEAKKTCEILRYASFDNRLPVEIEDKFILNAFQTIVKRGMKHIVISVDAATGRLFRSRYGFQFYSELPNPRIDTKGFLKQLPNPPDDLKDFLAQFSTPKKDVQEYLYYLDVDSDEFSKTVTTLAKNSESIKISGDRP